MCDCGVTMALARKIKRLNSNFNHLRLAFPPIFCPNSSNTLIYDLNSAAALILRSTPLIDEEKLSARRDHHQWLAGSNYSISPPPSLRSTGSAFLVQLIFHKGAENGSQLEMNFPLAVCAPYLEFQHVC